jgi:hypothetical protein
MDLMLAAIRASCKCRRPKTRRVSARRRDMHQPLTPPPPDFSFQEKRKIKTRATGELLFHCAKIPVLSQHQS